MLSKQIKKFILKIVIYSLILFLIYYFNLDFGLHCYQTDQILEEPKECWICKNANTLNNINKCFVGIVVTVTLYYIIKHW